MNRNILPPLAFQFAMPRLKLAGDGFDLVGLLHRIDANLTRELAGNSGWRNLPDGMRGVVVDPFAEFFEHLDGGADLGGGGSLHDEVRCGCRVTIGEVARVCNVAGGLKPSP